jgi:hypothetical protein
VHPSCFSCWRKSAVVCLASTGRCWPACAPLPSALLSPLLAGSGDASTVAGLFFPFTSHLNKKRCIGKRSKRKVPQNLGKIVEKKLRRKPFRNQRGTWILPPDRNLGRYLAGRWQQAWRRLQVYNRNLRTDLWMHVQPNFYFAPQIAWSKFPTHTIFHW